MSNMRIIYIMLNVKLTCMESDAGWCETGTARRAGFNAHAPLHRSPPWTPCLGGRRMSGARSLCSRRDRHARAQHRDCGEMDCATRHRRVLRRMMRYFHAVRHGLHCRYADTGAVGAARIDASRPTAACMSTRRVPHVATAPVAASHELIAHCQADRAAAIVPAGLAAVLRHARSMIAHQRR